MIHRLKHLIAYAGLAGGYLLVAATTASGQASGDSINAWMARLGNGSLAERMEAESRLAALDPGTLPASAAEALVEELHRVHRHWLDGAAIPGEEEIGKEGVVEYHASLVHAVLALASPEGDRALIPAVGTSGAVADRVARLGAAAVPELLEIMDRDFDRAGALRTLGRMWDLADAREIALSAEVRRTILTRILAAAGGGEAADRFGATGALRATGDPAFLPLVRRLEERAEAERDIVLGSTRRARQTLEAIAGNQPPDQLARGTYRLLALVCTDATHGPRRGACQSILNELEAALRHLLSGRTGPARNTFTVVIRRADTALDARALTADEHAIVVGGVGMVLDRM